MLSRTTHLIYITAILLLVAALLRPSLQRPPTPAENGSNDAGKSSAPSHVRTTPTSILTDDNDLLQLAMLDGPEAADSGATFLAQRAAKISDAQLPSASAAAPQILDLPSDRLGKPSIDGNKPRLTTELIDRCLAVAREIDPEFGQRLSKLRDKDSSAFERIIQQRGGRLLAMAQLKQSDLDLYKTKVSELSQTVQVNRVAAKLRHAMQSGASPGQVEVLQNQLRTLLQTQLAISIKSRGEYLCLLEEKIQKVRTDINAEAKHFQETVEGRLQHYIRQPGDETPDGSSSDSSSDEEPGH